MRPINRIIGIIVATAALASASTPRHALAVQASPHPIKINQPDNTPITLYIRGNEYFHWQEDEAGFTVVKSPAGPYVYAVADAAGRLQPTPLQVGKVNPTASGLRRRALPPAQVVNQLKAQVLPGLDRGAPRAMGLTATSAVAPAGDVKNVVILMRFKNHQNRQLPSVADFDKIFNAPGGDPTLAPTGSVRDVYLENSYGAFKLNSTVFAWVDLPNDEKYYAAGVSGLGPKIQEAITDALKAADAQVNFKDFDKDNDGYVDAISFVHSGYGAEWGGVDADGADYKDRIWSHRWAIPEWTSAEGVKVRDYHINPALWGVSGHEAGHIGVIAHETGHFFGLPDLYDTDGGGEGIGSWCMMANSWGFDGSQQYPPHFSAWCKIALKWAAPTELTTPGVYTAPQAETPEARIFKITTGFPAGEYLLVENRQPVGFDRKIPPGAGGAGGLAIWHVDQTKGSNQDEGFPGQSGWPQNDRHYMVALLQADGNYDLEKGNNRGDAGDVYRQGFKDELIPTTVPNSQAYQGGNPIDTKVRVTDISATGRNMTFRFGIGEGDGGGNGDKCCPVVASASFPWNLAKKASQNANLLSVTFTLTEESIVHIDANTSAETTGAPVTARTGFYDGTATNVMWTDSYRKVRFPGRAQPVDFGSNVAVRLPAGRHTIYWKFWLTGPTVQFDSGVITVKAFPLSAQPAAVARGNGGAAAPQTTAAAADDQPARDATNVDGRGNGVTVTDGEPTIAPTPPPAPQNTDR